MSLLKKYFSVLSEAGTFLNGWINPSGDFVDEPVSDPITADDIKTNLQKLKSGWIKVTTPSQKVLGFEFFDTTAKSLSNIEIFLVKHQAVIDASMLYLLAVDSDHGYIISLNDAIKLGVKQALDKESKEAHSSEDSIPKTESTVNSDLDSLLAELARNEGKVSEVMSKIFS